MPVQETTEKLQAELRASKAAQDSLEAAHEAMQHRLSSLRTDLADKEALLDSAGQEIEQLQESNAFLTVELKGSQVYIMHCTTTCRVQMSCIAYYNAVIDLSVVHLCSAVAECCMLRYSSPCNECIGEHRS